MRPAIAVIALCLAQAALAAEGDFSLGSGLNYSSGTYGGSSSTRILTLPLTARYESEPWTLRATVPYLRITGPSAVFPGVGRVDNRSILDNVLRSRTQDDRRTVSGIGDSTLAATYTVYSGTANRSGIGLTGKLKFPTGDETQGLGTGSTDASFQIEGFQQLERNTLFGAIGYTAFGDSPIAQFQNVGNLGIGATHRTDGGELIGIAFDARQAGSPAPAPLRELTGFWTHRIDRDWRMQAYVLRGFARGSPDWGAGVSAAYAF
jgi:hypothetical protein